MSTDACVVVFDGYCHLCSGWVRFMARHAITPPFRLLCAFRGRMHRDYLPHFSDAFM